MHRYYFEKAVRFLGKIVFSLSMFSKHEFVWIKFLLHKNKNAYRNETEQTHSLLFRFISIFYMKMSFYASVISRCCIVYKTGSARAMSNPDFPILTTCK
jgi:hypothetical protein